MAELQNNPEERRKRQTAYIVSIGDIITGEFIKVGGWEPNYVKTSFGLRVSRANVVGTILEKKENEITIDDTSGIINIRTFEKFEPFNSVTTGDFIMVVGKVRQFNSDIYITPEICKKIDKAWHDYRLEEIYLVKKIFREGKIKQEQVKVQVNITSSTEEKINEESKEEENSKKESTIDKVLTFIEEFDDGNGVEKGRILNKFRSEPTIEKLFEKLVNDGDIFEIKPGLFKLLK